jgi:hypothetical protein
MNVDPFAGRTIRPAGSLAEPVARPDKEAVRAENLAVMARHRAHWSWILPLIGVVIMALTVRFVRPKLELMEVAIGLRYLAWAFYFGGVCFLAWGLIDFARYRRWRMLVPLVPGLAFGAVIIANFIQMVGLEMGYDLFWNVQYWWRTHIGGRSG